MLFNVLGLERKHVIDQQISWTTEKWLTLIKQVSGWGPLFLACKGVRMCRDVGSVFWPRLSLAWRQYCTTIFTQMPNRIKWLSYDILYPKGQLHRDIMIFCKKCFNKVPSFSAQKQQLDWCVEVYIRKVAVLVYYFLSEHCAILCFIFVSQLCFWCHCSVQTVAVSFGSCAGKTSHFTEWKTFFSSAYEFKSHFKHAQLFKYILWLHCYEWDPICTVQTFVSFRVVDCFSMYEHKQHHRYDLVKWKHVCAWSSMFISELFVYVTTRVCVMFMYAVSAHMCVFSDMSPRWKWWCLRVCLGVNPHHLAMIGSSLLFCSRKWLNHTSYGKQSIFGSDIHSIWKPQIAPIKSLVRHAHTNTQLFDLAVSDWYQCQCFSFPDRPQSLPMCTQSPGLNAWCVCVCLSVCVCVFVKCVCMSVMRVHVSTVISVLWQ